MNFTPRSVTWNELSRKVLFLDVQWTLNTCALCSVVFTATVTILETVSLLEKVKRYVTSLCHARQRYGLSWSEEEQELEVAEVGAEEVVILRMEWQVAKTVIL